MNKQRYARQLSLDKIGLKGQEALLNAKITIIGCGGLGAIAAAYLAGAGVGSMTLIDGDRLHISNLHRQVFFQEESTGLSKADELAKHIQNLNSDVELTVISDMLSKENIDKHLENTQLILECTDDILTKYLVNDHCHQERIALVYGAIHKYEGMVSFFPNENEQSIHLRDIFPESDLEIPTCSEVGVLNTIAGIIGLFQANEAIKHITGCGPVLEGKLLTYDALNNEQYSIKLKKTWTSSKAESITMSTLSFSEIPSISFENLMKNVNSYRIISLLEDHEFVSLCDHVERLPHSEYEWMEWEDDGRPTIFYCGTGKRAMQVVYDLKEKNMEAEIYFLKATIAELDLG
jgi:adenylyltransferase/sulfurtransferase